MGPYCKFCDQRCFVPHPEKTPKYVYVAYGTSTIIATCHAGQQFEMERLGYCYDRILKEIAIVAEHKCAVCKESLDTNEAPIAEDNGYGQTVYVHPHCHPENIEWDACPIHGSFVAGANGKITRAECPLCETEMSGSEAAYLGIAPAAPWQG